MEEIRPPAALGNPILRRYFRGRYEQVNSGSRLRRRREPLFLDQYIDSQINYLLNQLDKGVQTLDASLRELEDRRGELSAHQEEGREAAGRSRLKVALKAVEDDVKDLRELIRLPLPSLKSRSDFKPVIDRKAITTAFEREIRFVSDQIEKAKQGIEDYFFTPTNIVELVELEGENMLVSLDRAHKMSKELQKQLR